MPGLAAVLLSPGWVMALPAGTWWLQCWVPQGFLWFSSCPRSSPGAAPRRRRSSRKPAAAAAPGGVEPWGREIEPRHFPERNRGAGGRRGGQTQELSPGEAPAVLASVSPPQRCRAFKPEQEEEWPCCWPRQALLCRAPASLALGTSPRGHEAVLGTHLSPRTRRGAGSPASAGCQLLVLPAPHQPAAAAPRR